ncbi:MAG TPA: hypothetical protein VGP03_03660 [Pseudonocardiaceae bacterium]|nr:hypothetical protein [Pseudonocardiaceae bacterium]
MQDRVEPAALTRSAPPVVSALSVTQQPATVWNTRSGGLLVPRSAVKSSKVMGAMRATARLARFLQQGFLS